MIRPLVKLLVITLLILMHSGALGQALLDYPDWFENPTFSVENNYSASSCVTVRNNDLQAAKETALINTRKEITSYLNGLPTEKEGSSLVAAKGVYLSTSQRVLDTNLDEELFCVLGSIPYSRIEESMDTGLTVRELLQAMDVTNASGCIEGDCENGRGKWVSAWLQGYVYEGEFLNGEKHGQGKKTWTNGDFYEGEFSNDSRTEKGKKTRPTGKVYEGDSFKGENHSKENVTNASGCVEGDCRNGQGKYTWPNGDVYEGDWLNGDRTGQGKLTLANGNVYEGDWLKDDITGQGKFTGASGWVYEGDFLNNELHGQGKYTWANGASYEGDFLNSKRTGNIRAKDGNNEEVRELIRKTMDNHVLALIKKSGHEHFLETQYPVLQEYEGDFNVLTPTNVFLFYEGLASGSLWSKPGALNFGGEKLGTFSFISGPVQATVLAHEYLEGGRNYFFVVLSDSRQGWVGRPYVKKDRVGREFLMPNPLTGESIQTAFEIPKGYYIKQFRGQPEHYIPSYDSINWDPRIPIQFRQEGYRRYRNAVSDGYLEVDRLVNQYMTSY